MPVCGSQRLTRLALGLCALALPLAAQEKPKADDDLAALMDLLQTPVKSASKVAQRPMDAPSVISPVSREQLRTHGWDSINEVLYAQPGFSPSMDYDRRTVSARGMFEGWNNNHLLMLIDGVPMNDNLYGSAYTWEITPLFMAKSLEVLRGPGSALYGSNATNGVVAINTLSAGDIAGPGEARVRMGNHGGRQVDAVTGLSGDSFSGVIAYSRFATSGDEYQDYDTSERLDGAGNLAKFRTWDKRSSDYFFGKVEGLGDLKGLSFQYHHQAWQFGTGHGWVFFTPDFAESMKEWRDIVSIAYRRESGAWSQEYVYRYQRHAIDWNQRYYPNGTDFGAPYTYLNGLSEYLDTSADEIFGRAQATYTFGKDGSVVFGLEVSRFTYDGDRSHTSNVNINSDGSFAPWDATNSTQSLKPWLEWTKGHPVLKTGFYAQAASGKMLDSKFSATLGIRYDKQGSDFKPLDNPGGSSESLSFSHVSPRLALIYHGGDTFSVKLLAGEAFRTPAPTELFGANTYSLFSNIRNLKPEIIDTFELASDWTVNKHLGWKLNLFHTKFRNQIGYSPSLLNQSANLYTLTTQGLETELYFSHSGIQGFANASYARRVKEEIQDGAISVQAHDVTWVPAMTFNAGANYKTGPWTAGLTVHHQGSVTRRDSDFHAIAGAETPVNATFHTYRPGKVGAWTSFDLRAAYKFSRGVELELVFKNATDIEGALAKPSNSPFDYRTEPRRITFGIRIN